MAAIAVGMAFSASPAFAACPEPGAVRLSAWELDESPVGIDHWSGNDLTFNGAIETDYSWVVDRYNMCGAAYGLPSGGSGWAATAGPVISTEDSFTIAAWARFDDLGTDQTIAAQSGTNYGAFSLDYDAESGRIELAMPQSDEADTAWVRVVADEATATGTWYHVAAQVDVDTGVARLYVDGVLQAERPAVLEPWQSTGPLTIGAAEQFGEMTDQMAGAVDLVQTWSGALDSQSIADLADDRPQYPADPDDADCGGSEEPPPIDLL